MTKATTATKADPVPTRAARRAVPLALVALLAGCSSLSLPGGFDLINGPPATETRAPTAPRPEPEPTMQEALGVEDQIEMTVDKRYICEVCGREAKSPQGLRVHMAVHKRAGDTTKQEVREQERRSG